MKGALSPSVWFSLIFYFFLDITKSQVIVNYLMEPSLAPWPQHIELARSYYLYEYTTYLCESLRNKYPLEYCKKSMHSAYVFDL